MRLHLFRALQSRNFRLFFAGQSISLIGTWMQQVAMSWLVYRLTGSAFLLGVVGFAGQIPTFVLAPLAGVLADRWNRRRLLLWTQIFAMVQATILAAAYLTGALEVWHIVALSLLLGVINAFDIPVRQSFVVEMLARKDDLGNAIALNSSMVNGARLIGPSLAGILIATAGEGVCFIINAASYMAVITAILAMRIAPARARQNRKHVLLELKEGVGYAFGFAPIRNILLLVGAISLAGLPYTVLMPIFAGDVLGGGPRIFGLLLTAAGAGALAATLYLASRRSVLGLGKVISFSAALFAAGIIGFSLSGVLILSLLFLCIGGFGAMSVLASSNTLLQTIVEDEKRGRVMSLFSMAVIGMTPLGSLAVGTIAARIGPQPTLIAGGVACLVAGALFAREIPAMRTLVHPIYVKMGIIPEVAAGLQTAAELTVPPEEQ